MLDRLMATRDDWSLMLLRLATGIMILPHGLQKAFGMFGGGGISGTVEFLNGGLHIPVLLVYLAIAAEILGGVGLILGVLTRVAAFAVLCNMVIGVLMVHLPNGFFMNWSGTQKGEGVEFHLLAVSILLVIMVRGAGAFSIDGATVRPDRRFT